MTRDEIIEFYGKLEYQKDIRWFPDDNRRSQFVAGWRDFTVRKKQYVPNTLKKLTWHNIGYRFGVGFGEKPHREILEVYEILANIFYSKEQISSDGNLSNPEEELGESSLFPEGAVHTVHVNSYERNPEARRKCISIYGATCCICGFNFREKYGPEAHGFIHVHHLKPISAIGAQYRVDPENDLRPVCPNCHAVLHMRNPPYSIEEVRGFIGE